MALGGKHTFGEINGTRVTFIEKKIGVERAEFLKKLLEYNGFEVIISPEKKKKEEDPDLVTVAVTDMVFNPTIWIFERKLKTPDGHIVTSDYWFQKSTDTSPQYWENAYKK